VIEAKKDVIEFHDENSMMRNEKSIEKKTRRRKQRCDKQITHARDQKDRSKVEIFNVID
jgi:hypothetical protein